MKPLPKAVLCTLAYADIFDYPLKEKEIWRFLISTKKESPVSVKKTLLKLPQVSQKEDYFFLRARKDLVALRRKRARLGKKKLKIASKMASWLKLVPFIKLVALTGALAMENSQKDDDIDFLIITSKNRLWLTRLLTVLLIELVGSRRRPGDKKFEDKVCLNMFLAESHLALPKKERDLFSAHEVCQMKLLWEKDNTYQKFLKANQWVRRYLPNWKA